jgi:nitrite reductase/ring-hydroxylating ferredoxin subunit
VSVDRRDIAVFNVGGRLSAIADRCPHEGASLSRWQVGGVVVSAGPGDYRVERPGKMVLCPWHGWEFDLAPGGRTATPRG